MSLYGQTPCERTINPSIDNYLSMEEDRYRLSDTLSQKVDLVFEQSFDDTVVIMVDSCVKYKSVIKTKKFVGVCDSSFLIDYSRYNNIPLVSIYLINKNVCISFRPRKGQRIAYINYLCGAWSIELSNVVRGYN